jgi:outer membrane protein OmpA-like peptidoglycan-associated protein
VRSIVLFFFIPFISFSQQKDYSTCEHALDVHPKGVITLSFIGKKGVVPSEGVFQHLTSPSKNQIWLHFTCADKGTLKLSFKQASSPIHVLILKEKEGDLCSSLKEQTLQVLLEKSIDSLDALETQIPIEVNDQYYLVFLAKEKSKQEIRCALSFEPEQIDVSKTWPLNLVYNEGLPVYSLAIRDESTKKPIEARIVLQGSTEINGIYRASDLEMNLVKKVKGGTIRVDAEGFLSSDRENTTIPITTSFRDTIWLKPIQEGMMAELDDVYFAAGLATVLEESYPKLKRLRDFLILNPTVNIEVHGHVNEDSDKDLVSMKLSKKRAQKVVDYLVDGGVDSKRLKAIGFGNTKPIFKDPQTEEEKEANRRVEIRISTN